MLNEDQHLGRTPDLIAKVHKLREEAEARMNRFTRITDYDVRYVVGHGPKPVPVREGPVIRDEEHPKSLVTEATAAPLPVPAEDEEPPA